MDGWEKRCTHITAAIQEESLKLLEKHNSNCMGDKMLKFSDRYSILQWLLKDPDHLIQVCQRINRARDDARIMYGLPPRGEEKSS